MSHIAVLTSGGDSPGMNTAVMAIARSADMLGMSLIGIDRGYNGLLGKNPDKDFIRLSLENALDIADLAGTQLRTARCLEFKNLEVQQRAAQLLRERDVRGVIVIGGDGSFKGAQALCKQGIPCIGIPGTIDNDLPYTSMTLGFDTAVNVCVDAVRSIRATPRIAASWKGKSNDEESPGFTETRYQITSGWRNPRESAAENYRRNMLFR